MKTNGIRFFPLYWIYHDQWRVRSWHSTAIHWVPDYCNHDGHMHFWMMGFDSLDSNQQAYSGNQKYEFSLQDQWSPRSNDVNQQQNFRIVGLPKWYFYVEEYWRRVYIQQWEYLDNNNVSVSNVGKKGIMYDASKPYHTFGPFREGKDNFFMRSDLARTLPVEYWHNDKKTVRDHYLRYGEGVPDGKEFVFDFEKDIDIAENRDKWVIPVGETAGQDNRGLGNPNENDARRSAYPDHFYLSPALEYQKVIHLDWERLPGFEDRDIEDEETGEHFGDGFDIRISIPFTIDGKIQSPFSDDKGIVYPTGTYCHGVVKDEDKLKYKELSDPPSEYDPPTELAGQNVIYNQPNNSWPQDGKWVEQCLGAIVQAKAKVILEDNWGGRFTNWVHTTQFIMNEEFEGKDQNGPYPEE